MSETAMILLVTGLLAVVDFPGTEGRGWEIVIFLAGDFQILIGLVPSFPALLALGYFSCYGVLARTW